MHAVTYFFYYGFLALLIAFISTFFLTTPLHAQSSALGLTVSPLRAELSISPGTVQKQALRVSNVTDTSMSVQLTNEEFSVINPDYDYSFNEDSAIQDWVRFSQTTVELEPGESKVISYDIAVPLGTEPGGTYISIFASNDLEKDLGAISSRQRIGILLYITVDGDVTRAGNLLSLSHPWIVGGPSDWSVSVQNQGTAHFRSRYSAELFTLFGNNPVAKMEGDALVLPGTVRRVTESLPVPEFPGIYKAVYNIGLGDQPAYSDTRYVTYIPVWLWASVVAGLVIAALLSIRRKKTAA